MANTVVTNTFVRRQVESAPETIIDGYLTQEQINALYGTWLPDWPDKREYRGGITAITSEMVMQIPEEDFIKAFGRRKVMKDTALAIRKIAERTAGR